MAYQNVGTPRFYINVIEWLDSLDAHAMPRNIFRTLSVTMQTVSGNNGDYEYQFTTNIGFNSQSFYAVLGYTADHWGIASNNVSPANVNFTGIVNPSGDLSADVAPEYLGWSLGTFNGESLESGWRLLVAQTTFTAGSIILGTYYDMPHSPNLSLTMSREYGGIKEFTTHNGSSMSNTMWSSAPQWGDLGAWELGDSNPALSKSGRRIWDLTFSYMDDGDLWGSNPHLGTGEWGIQDSSLYGDDLYTEGANAGLFLYDIITDDKFFSQVWHKTLAGTLPFIFQPDSSNSNPDQFAICRFKDNSLKATQSAFNVYDISLSIEEVW